jgi:hypothetical protein
MNAGLYLCLTGALALGVAIAAGTPRRDTPPHLWPSVVGLVGVIAGLLAVGMVSGTISRHLVQVTPAAVALALVAAGSTCGRAAALPVVTFWGGLMVTIWLFLLGLHRMIGGRFTGVEIALTVAIAAACLVGLRGGGRPTANAPHAMRLATAIAFGLFQLAAFWASLQPFALLR